MKTIFTLLALATTIQVANAQGYGSYGYGPSGCVSGYTPRTPVCGSPYGGYNGVSTTYPSLGSGEGNTTTYYSGNQFGGTATSFPPLGSGQGITRTFYHGF